MELEQIYKSIQPNIYAFFFVKTLNKELAEELTQEVFFQVVKGYSSFTGKSTIKTWTFAIAKNILKKHYRSKKYKRKLTNQLTEDYRMTESTEDSYIKKEERERLLQIINGLEDSGKEVVILRMYGEMSFKEIGELMETSENYARVTFHRAKLKIQKELNKNE